MYTTSYTDITKEKGEMISKSFATLNSYGLDNKKMYVANISLDCKYIVKMKLTNYFHFLG